MEILDQQVGAIELFLRRETVGFLDRDARDGVEQWSKNFLNANIIVLASSVIFGATQPENMYIPCLLYTSDAADE